MITTLILAGWSRCFEFYSLLLLSDSNDTGSVKTCPITPQVSLFVGIGPTWSHCKEKCQSNKNRVHVWEKKLTADSKICLEES